MGHLRVVGGTLRGRKLRVPDQGVRPTSERAREAIFDILGAVWTSGANVLDLYAGTGALGIEALSRGAARADFVERDPAVGRLLRANLASLGLEERTRVVIADLDRGEWPPALAGPWNLVFLDPPYAGEGGARWLDRLARAPWPPDGGLVVYEHRSGSAIAPPPGLALATERAYGDTAVSIYRAGGPRAPAERGATT
ncbi:MAG TPA: 16S rRNA (guanine(966)-N(2))-methyltransferase RsmD [Candidatus Eisenbacteria bacterium]|nr:16S rRNA (guanine(966)-N(2))-methyltransferase RsmD [Candidatus Eisenbacteria bacterium]